VKVLAVSLLSAWQLPQNAIGLLLTFCCRSARRERRGGAALFYCFNRFGGLSLGSYLFVHRDADERLVRHEYGHYRQSKLLGPLYLIVIGLPSILWAGLFPLVRRLRPATSYFSFPTERWADYLGGADRPPAP